MRLSLTHYGVTHSIDTDADDLPAEDVVRYLFGLALSAGYPQEALASWFMQVGSEHCEKTVDTPSSPL